MEVKKIIEQSIAYLNEGDTIRDKKAIAIKEFNAFKMLLLNIKVNLDNPERLFFEAIRLGLSFFNKEVYILVDDYMHLEYTYKGLIKVAKQQGLKNIVTQDVYGSENDNGGDKFEFKNVNGVQTFTFELGLNREVFKGYFASAITDDGEVFLKYMSAKDLKNFKEAYGVDWDNSAHYLKKMYRKTVLKQLLLENFEIEDTYKYEMVSKKRSKSTKKDVDNIKNKMANEISNLADKMKEQLDNNK
jgi:hypothetical protein